MTEFSRQVPIDDVTSKAREIAFAATPAECVALAGRLEIEAVGRLEGHARLFRPAKDLIRLEARFEAEVVQASVVTLEPVAARIEERFVQDFCLSAPPPPLGGGDEEIDLDGLDPPEYIAGDAIDFAEIVTQHLALALDPYPAENGLSPAQRDDVLKRLIPAENSDISIGEAAPEEPPEPRLKPFEVLRRLKSNG